MSSFQKKALLASVLTTTLAADPPYLTAAKTKHEPMTTFITGESLSEPLLLERQQSTAPATCGYRNGKADQPLICGDYSSCGFFNTYGVMACCAETSITQGSYQPYFCSVYTTCYDSTQAKDFQIAESSMPPTEGYDNFLPIYCGVSAYPYCNLGKYTDYSYSFWSCGSTSAVTQEYAYYASTIDAEDSTTSTLASAITISVILTTPAISTSTTTSNNDAVETFPKPSIYASEVPQQDESIPLNRTGAIVGGTMGGAVALATVAAIVLFVRHKRKRRETHDVATQPSFNVIGSNITAPVPPIMASTDPVPLSHARALTPCLSEVDGENDHHSKPVDAPSLLYQPHRRPESEASVSTFEPSTHIPYRQQFPTSVLPRHIDSHPSFLHLSDMEEMPVNSSRHNTDIPPERRQSKFAELDAAHMSMQSGPIPEWETRELPR